MCLTFNPDVIRFVNENPTEKHNKKKGTSNKNTGIQTVEEKELINRLLENIVAVLAFAWYIISYEI